ncbi:MAG: hypothetical protein BGN85_02540, partial [Alphaproteobacteria bacterium 64-11]
MAFLRIWILAALCLGLWLLAAHGLYRPTPVPAGAPRETFSALRAGTVLGKVLGPQKPHPAGSPENAAVHSRLLDALAGLGVDAQTGTTMSCFGETRWHAVSCGTVGNIFAEVTPGLGDPVLLMAHLDSVAAGPGACDDGCGVATLLETIRALKASGFAGRHPIDVLFTDGEEGGMLGAAAFLRAGTVRPLAVINVEARGNQGPSYLFQTSPGNAPLIDLYARNVSHYATSSLYAEIYKYLPNDTDLTPFLQAGVTGYNFALIGNIAAYHTPLDVRAGIDLSGLQQHGEAALGLSRALANSDAGALKGGEAIYLDILGRWLPRLSAGWALPLAIAAFVLILVAGMLRRRDLRTPGRPLLALAMPPLLLAGSVAMGFALHGLAVWIAGTVDPSFAHPVWLRLSLGFGVWAVALATARGSGAVASWGWMGWLAIACALLAPGLSPYFLFPALVAAPLLLITARGGRGLALLIAAIPALVIWLQLNAGTEPLMGLKVHPIFTVTAAFALVPVLPLLAPVRGPAWTASFAVALVLALGLAAVAGMVPAHSPAAPARMNITYLENRGKAAWLVNGDIPPDSAMAAAAGATFSDAPVRIPGLGLSGYLAPAGAAKTPVPGAELDTHTSGGVVLTMHGSAQADGMILDVPARAGLKSLSVDGVPSAASGNTMILCRTPDCARARIVLDGDFRNVWLRFAEVRRGLPPRGALLSGARPRDAVPSGQGDQTVIGGSIGL